MSYNVGTSDYAKRRIQPWDIWEEYQLDPWDADIVKRVLRTKDGEDPRLDYEKIIHICKKKIDMINKMEKDVCPTSSHPCVRILLDGVGILPQKATDGSAGYDLFAPYHVLIKPGRNVVPLGFRMALPVGIGATPNPRSGFTLKGFEGYKDWQCTVSIDQQTFQPNGEPSRMNADVCWGLIDMDYRGNCGVLVISHENEPFLLARGTRFAQMCFQYYETVDFIQVGELDETERGCGGFNSTGTK